AVKIRMVSGRQRFRLCRVNHDFVVCSVKRECWHFRTRIESKKSNFWYLAAHVQLGPFVDIGKVVTSEPKPSIRTILGVGKLPSLPCTHSINKVLSIYSMFRSSRAFGMCFRRVVSQVNGICNGMLDVRPSQRLPLVR